MPSPDRSLLSARLLWLARKELREIAVSRASILVMMVVGPLVAQAFSTAVRSYAEVSGSSGVAALSQGISPLDGFVVPVLGAYALVATLLLPFVAIRSVSAEKSSGALALLVQGETSVSIMLVIKLLALLVWWTLAWVPGVIALLLWRGMGGHLYAPETASVLLGHFAHGMLVMLIAFAAAALSESASSAAVIALGVTLGAWALDFVASVHGGWAARAARFTPESMLRVFERGELDLRVALIIATAMGVLFAITALAWRPARPRRLLLRAGAVIAVLSTTAVFAITRIPARHTAVDVSEDQRNSLPAADARALSAVHGTIVVTARLGVQDPRLADLERNVLQPISRAVSIDLRVDAVGSTGMFEASGTGYGEIWYAWRGRRRMSRSTTLPIVLETLYDLTGTRAAALPSANAYPGYPIASASPSLPMLLLLSVAWPLAVLAGWWSFRRR